jgi:DNA polymerase-3 subunit epsilon
VTFCVLDLETTGGSAADCSITEVGALKVRGGECIGTFQTLVNPGRAVPPTITILTGISDSMLIRAPRIEAVLPSLLEFIGDTVVVGHNVRFDMSFIQEALRRDERPRIRNMTIDTLALARRLLRDDVPNCKLGTLADRLRLDHKPSHRALDDALATADLLHVLIDRAGSLGVSGLDDLAILPTLAGSAHISKLRLTDRLPRSPGIYLLRDGAGRVLYVGKATNLRARVRQYFSSENRRKVGPLLRETVRIDHKRCATELEAAVLEIRMIHHLEPRYNRQGTRWRSSAYLKLTLAERYPRLSVVRQVRADGALYLGPLASTRVATMVAEAIHSVVPLRRCAGRPGRNAGTGPCIPAQLGVSLCPCAGDVDPLAYAAAVDTAARGMTCSPHLLVDPLWERMERLGADGRFEEAADTRDRLSALVDALARQRRFDQLRAARRVVIDDGAGGSIELRRGRLTRLREPIVDGALALDDGWRAVEAAPADPGPPEAGPLPPGLADELTLVARWLDRNAGRGRLAEVSGVWASPSQWIAPQVELLKASRR